MAVTSKSRGKYVVYCNEPHCGWKSTRLGGEDAAYQALSKHNYNKHPGVFPRWDPDFQAREKRRKGLNESDKDQEAVDTS